jgi:deoxyribonuclease V
MNDVCRIDGYVMLGKGRAGLGQRLFVRLGAKIPVIGVAKSKFEGACPVVVFRAGSRRPLFVTAAGTDVGVAAEKIRSMHGSLRIPTLLRRVDRLARQDFSP